MSSIGCIRTWCGGPDKEIHVRMRIPFNRPTYTGNENQFVQQAMQDQKIGPGGTFVRECQDWLTDRFDVPLVLPTGSCTAALELSAILLDLVPGDEVILPSFAYTSTATAIARTGATPVFVDIVPDTMNIDPDAVEAAINSSTRAIFLIHYAGIACDMDKIAAIADQHDLAIVEDAALAFLARHKGRLCGTLGTFGCFSFHETKTVHCGQGGALVLTDSEFIARAEIILEKGTDRRKFLRNEVDRYTWQDIGSAYALDNIRSAYLLAQLQSSETITRDRIALWQHYDRSLAPLARAGKIETAQTPDYADPNGHIYWLKVADETERSQLISYLAEQGIHAVFHYVPLHSATAGIRFGRFAGDDRFTTHDAARLVRLPLFHRLQEIEFVVERIFNYYEAR